MTPWEVWNTLSSTSYTSEDVLGIKLVTELTSFQAVLGMRLVTELTSFQGVLGMRPVTELTSFQAVLGMRLVIEFGLVPGCFQEQCSL